MMSNDDDLKSQEERSPPSAAARRAGAGKEDWIGAHLRKVYDETLREPVPDRFLSLLKEIAKKESRS